jgi:hypothetical protein
MGARHKFICGGFQILFLTKRRQIEFVGGTRGFKNYYRQKNHHIYLKSEPNDNPLLLIALEL